MILNRFHEGKETQTFINSIYSYHEKCPGKTARDIPRLLHHGARWKEATHLFDFILNGKFDATQGNLVPVHLRGLRGFQISVQNRFHLLRVPTEVQHAHDEVFALHGELPIVVLGQEVSSLLPRSCSDSTGSVWGFCELEKGISSSAWKAFPL